jgi:hypothetical protein
VLRKFRVPDLDCSYWFGEIQAVGRVRKQSILFRVMRAIAQKVPQAAGTIRVVIWVSRSVVAEPGFDTLKKAEMNTQANNPLHLPLLAGGIAAILVSGIAIGSLAISAQGFNGSVPTAEPPAAAMTTDIAAPDARVYRCAECGVIVSTRAIEAPDEKTGVIAPGRIAAGNRGKIKGKPVRNYEITVRLRDGSMRVVTDANPARWRHGEKVIIIAGAD